MMIEHLHCKEGGCGEGPSWNEFSSLSRAADF